MCCLATQVIQCGCLLKMRHCMNLLPHLRRRPLPCLMDSTALRRHLSITKNYYELLELTPKATTQDIKDAYIRLCKLHHPDMNPTDPAAYATFQKISNAYETLANVVTRKEYDMNTFGDSYFKRKTFGGTGPLHTGKTEYYDIDEWARQHYGAEFDARVRELKKEQESQLDQRERERSDSDVELDRQYHIKVAVAVIAAAVAVFSVQVMLLTQNFDTNLASAQLTPKTKPSDLKK